MNKANKIFQEVNFIIIGKYRSCKKIERIDTRVFEYMFNFNMNAGYKNSFTKIVEDVILRNGDLPDLDYTVTSKSQSMVIEITYNMKKIECRFNSTELELA